MNLMRIYNLLLKEHGHQNWWPCRTSNKFEVCVGAILTQNTSWNNVEKAIDNLLEAGCMGAKKIASMDNRKLESLVKPSGFFRQKSCRLKEFSQFVLTFGSMEKFIQNVTRDELLGVNGIGPETADSILLYACGKPYFVVDAYTRRMFSALGMVKADMDYEGIRRVFEENMDKNVELYKEFHALIVNHAKTCCSGFVGKDCILRNLA